MSSGVNATIDCSWHWRQHALRHQLLSQVNDVILPQRAAYVAVVTSAAENVGEWYQQARRYGCYNIVVTICGSVEEQNVVTTRLAAIVIAKRSHGTPAKYHDDVGNGSFILSYHMVEYVSRIVTINNTR